MKKIKFNIRRYAGCGENRNPKTELREVPGYLFELGGYKFVVHKVPTFVDEKTLGWRVSEYTTGMGVTKTLPTRKKAIALWKELMAENYFAAQLPMKIKDAVENYGDANNAESD